jgi:hypothetical protein
MATARLHATIETHLVVSDATRNALIALGWTPPAEPEPEPTNDPINITPYLVVQRYRQDHGGHAWAMRCWGDGTCDGHLALDLDNRAYAERKARAHLATEHPAEAPTP